MRVTIGEFVCTIALTAIVSGGIASAQGPTITSITPDTVTVAGPATSISITGTAFASGATVLFTPPVGAQIQINPIAVQSSQLVATVPPSLLRTGGTAEVAVLQPGSPASNALPFNILAGPLSVQTTAVPAVVAGVSYLATLNALGGSGPPYTWSIPSNALPPGLNLNSSTGVISGVPTAAGIFPFTVTVSDAATPTPHTASQNLSLLVGQQYVISTYAGGVPVPTPVQATLASLGDISVVTRDTAGNVFFISQNAVYKVDLSGVLTLIAGDGRQGYSGDGGRATQAQINSPVGLAIDQSGSVYVSEIGRIRKITPSGIITTFAGTGIAGFSGDGAQAIDAQVDPYGLALDGLGNLFFADFQTNRVRKVGPAGIITTVAGNGQYGYSGDGGPAIGASMALVLGIAADGAGNLYIADYGNNRVREVTTAGTISTIAGTGASGESGDGGPAAAAELRSPSELALDGANNLYILDSYAAVREIVAADATIHTVPGSVFSSYGFAVDNSGNLYGALNPPTRLAAFSPAGAVTILAGSGNAWFSGDGGSAAVAQLEPLNGMASDAAGNLYFNDSYGTRIRKISPAGIITTIAGDGTDGYAGDGGPAAGAEFWSASAVTFDQAGNLYVADLGNQRVRLIAPSGSIFTVVGNGTYGYSGDNGPALLAELDQPSSLALDSAGRLYIGESGADSGGPRIREVSNAGVITTVATFTGNLATDPSGDLLVAQSGGVTKIAPGGSVTTLASAASGLAGNPIALAADPAGNLFVGGENSGFPFSIGGFALQEVSPLGVVTNLAGPDGGGYTGDGGPAQNATIGQPESVTTDIFGNVFIGDFGNQTIRVLRPSTASPLSITSSSASPGTTLAATGGTLPYSWAVSGLPTGLSLNTSTGALDGTTAPAGTYDFTITVTDSGTVALTGTTAQIVSRNYRITVIPHLTLSTTALPVATVNVPYNATTIAVSGGTGPYTFSIANGSLPTGLAFDTSTGAISGTTSAGGVYSITVQAVDSGTPQESGTQTYVLTVQAPPVITTTSLPIGVVGTPYPNTTIAVTSGTPPYQFSFFGPAGFPVPGLSINPSTGIISGTPTISSSGSQVYIYVTDSGSPQLSASQVFILTIYSPITIPGNALLSDVSAMAPFSISLQASGGIPSAYSWSSATLPAWLNLTPGGVLSGTPPSAGPVTINVSITDGVQTVQQTMVLQVRIPTGQTWTQLTPTGTLPPGRSEHVAVLDEPAQQMIIFGGETVLYNDAGDVWSYSITANTWNKLSPTGTGPAARRASGGIYNAANSRMVIFGGLTDETLPNRDLFDFYYNDVWVLANANGLSGSPSWTMLNPSGTPPVGRASAAVVYDAVSNRMIVFGGGNNQGLLNDVWVLTSADGTGGTPAWLQLTPSGTPPSARGGMSSVYDPVSNELIVFGGGNTSTTGDSDVWILSNANGVGGTPAWIQQAPAGNPAGPHFDHSAIIDTTSDQMVVFGGSTSLGVQTSDTWALTNANGAGGTPTWTQLAPTGTPPSSRDSHSAVYLSSSNRMLVFGGNHLTGYAVPGLNDLWILSDANNITFITSLSPSSVIAGSGALTLTVSGDGFAPGAVVQWNGVALVTTFVSSTQLTAAVIASDVSTPGSVNVAVQNPTGTASTPQIYQVIPGPPVITTGSLPIGAIGIPYPNTTIQVAHGTPPYTFSLSNGTTLPPGLAIDSSTGIISGTPTAVISDNFTLTVTDSASPPLSSSRNLTIGIATTTAIALGTSMNPSKFGQSLTLIATLSPVTVTGKVTFYDGAIVLGTAPVQSGTSVLTTKLLPAGAHSLKAYFAFSGTYLASQSTPLTQIVGTVPVPSGGFTTVASYTEGMSFQGGADGIVSGDFNGDNVADLAVGNSSGGVISIYLGVGDGTFEAPVDYATSPGPVMLITGDFNGDGATDLAAAVTSGVSVLLGNGDGTFRAAINHLMPDSPQRIAAGDFNEDGKTDLVVTGNGANVLIGNGDGTFQSAVTYLSGTSSVAVTVSDFDSDGNPDLALIGPGAINILRGIGDGTFQAVGSYPAAQGQNGVAVGDFNGDGNADLAVANGTTGSVDVLTGNGDGTFGTAISYSVGASPLNVISGDFNGDGKADLATTSNPGGNLTVLLGKGNGSFQPAARYTSGNATLYAAAGDFNGDGATDIAVTNAGTQANVSVLLGVTGTVFQTITFGALSNVTTGAPPFTVSASSDSGLTVSFASATTSVCTVSGITVTIVAAGGCSIIASQPGNATYAPASVTESFTVFFADVGPGDYYNAAITAMAQKGITAGCGNNGYCPGDNVTRDEMAIFIVRAIYGSDDFTYTTTPYFTDVTPTTFGFKWIQKLKDLGVTAGCGAATYCPTDVVARDQMAIFIIRARLGLAIAGATPTFTYPATPYFTDVTASSDFAFPWIQRLKLENITAGCTATTYCPTDPVTRGDMAIFVMRGAFNQFLPAGTPILTEISPTTLPVGTSGMYTITGTNTNFVQGTTQLSPIPGVTIGTIAVNSATSMTVQLTAASNAVTQPYSILAITGSEQDVLPNGLMLQ